MTNRIQTYEDLLEEKQRLQLLLQTQKEVIRQDINEVKEQLAPVRTAISFVGKLTTKEPTNPLLQGTLDTIIDLVVRKLLLARAGWFTKFIIPFFLKNFSSHVIDEKKDLILQKLFSFFSKKKKPEGSNGAMHHVEEEEED